MEEIIRKIKGGTIMQKNNIILSSTEPITDGGRKYNWIYAAGAVIGFILGIYLGNVGAGILFAVCGMVVALGIKNMICKQMDNVLRKMTFTCYQRLPYEQLIQRLQPSLLPLGMTIERGKGGEPVISYKGLIYDVKYEQDNTFTIWWRQSVINALITRNEYISVYRKASVAYGIIAYHIQQICNGQSDTNQKNSIKTDKTIDWTESMFRCPECGAACKTDAKFCVKCGNALENVIGMKTMCPKCGNVITSGDRFCVKCGNQL